MFGTPAAATAIDADNCPRCDHGYMLSFGGADPVTHPFRGVDTPVWAAAPTAPAPSPEPSPLPADDDARFDVDVDVSLPWERGFEPEAPTLAELLVLATTLALARWGVTARLVTDDATTWQVVCVDPETGLTLDDHPSETRGDAHLAAQGFCDMLHELNLRDAGAPPRAPGLVRCEPAAEAPAAQGVA